MKYFPFIITCPYGERNIYLFDENYFCSVSMQLVFVTEKKKVDHKLSNLFNKTEILEYSGFFSFFENYKGNEGVLFTLFMH